jgi:hypothetical protein
MNNDSSGSKRDLRVDCTASTAATDPSERRLVHRHGRCNGGTYVDQAEGLAERVSEEIDELGVE